jgi:hypothetical protein
MVSKITKKMDKIDLQNKAKAKRGTAEMYWFENEFTGLKKTLFHRITIPLTAFNSGLEYESQSVKTEIGFEWLILNLIDPTDLDGLTITSQKYDRLEASVYIGGRHNWCDVIQLNIKRKKGDTYAIDGELLIEFENEGVAKNEIFKFQTTFKFVKNE